MSKSELTVSTRHKEDLDISLETSIDIDDLVTSLRVSERGDEIGMKLLENNQDCITELAQEMSDQQIEKLVCDLLDGLPESKVEEITSDYCVVCQERADLREAVEEIEEERNGS